MIELGEEYLRPLHRHFINITYRDHRPGAVQDNGGTPPMYHFSAFVVQINDDWLAITAGHIFSHLKKAIAHGAVLKDWAIDDSTVNPDPHPNTNMKVVYNIAFDPDKDVFYFDDDVEGMDYAAFKLDYLAVQAMQKEGIRAIPEDVWNKSDLQDFPYWLLVGTPEELIENPHGQPQVKRHATLHVIPRSGPAPGFAPTRYPRHYAEVDFGSTDHDGPFNLVGMSGGPIFGIKSPLEKIEDYRLIGVQSAQQWEHVKPTGNVIAFCAAQPFIKTLKETWLNRQAEADHP